MFCHSSSFLVEKKVRDKDLNHFTIALAEKATDRADASLCLKNYDVSVIDLSATYSKFLLKTDKIRR